MPSVFVNSPVKGVVNQVEVTVGQDVKQGDLLVVLTTTKTEHQVKADHDGKVVSVVSARSEVDPGHQLAEIAVAN